MSAEQVRQELAARVSAICSDGVAPEVFISYARSSSADPARALKAALDAVGHSAFLDEREIGTGESGAEGAWRTPDVKVESRTL